MSDTLFKEGAYHESGHIVMAYQLGYTSKLITLLEDDPGSGFTKFNFTNEEAMLFAAIEIFREDKSYFLSLPNHIKNKALRAASNTLMMHLAGPISESLYKSGFDFVGNLEIDMRGPDVSRVESADYFLSQFGKNHSLQNFMIAITESFKINPHLTAIKHLAEAILSSDTMSLNQEEIENSLQQSGFSSYIGSL